jgi:O-antigen/teichoic acid export membrane protein
MNKYKISDIFESARRKLPNVNAVGALVSRFLGMGLQFLSVLVMARALGAADIGMFSLYSSFLVLISAVIGFGSPVNSFTLVSRLHIKEDWEGIWQYFFDIVKVMLLVALFLLAAYFLLIQISVDWSESYLTVLPYSLVGAVIFVFLRNAFEFMQAMSKTTLAMALENVLSPLVMIAFIVVVDLIGAPIKAQWVMLVNMSIFAALAITMFKLTVHKPLHKQASSTDISLKIFHKSTFALWMSSILDMAFVNIPTILAAQVATMADVGRFSIAFRFIAMIASLLMVVRGTLGRDLIKNYHAKDYGGCQKIMWSMQKFGVIIYAPIMFIFAVGGEFLFNLFGKSFDGAYVYLLILGVGQLVYAGFGFSGFALVAMDEGKFEAFFSMLCMILMVGIAWALRDYSAKGVAVAFCVSICLRSFIPYLYARRKLIRLMAGA